MVTDVVLGAGLVAMLAFESFPWSGVGLQWERLVGLVVLVVAVVLARRYPLVSLTLAAALVAGEVLVTTFGSVGQYSLAYVGAAVAMSYLAGRRMLRGRPALLFFAVIFVAVFPFTLLTITSAPGLSGASKLVVNLVYMILALLGCGVFPWLLGRYQRQRAVLVLAGWERAEQLEHEQQIIAERERLRERARIAQDMHDSLGHELSLVAVLAGSLEVDPDADDGHRNSARALRTAASTATERLRDIIGVLREESEPAPLEPGRAGVTELIDRARTFGMAVDLRVDGDPPRTASLVDGAVHRVVQESLTNAAKHAPGAAVTVRLAHTPAHTTVTIVNERPPAGPLPGRARGRLGITGLRERVRLLGGTLRAEPRDGGFEVVAWIPRDGAVAVPGTTPAADPGAGATESARRLNAARRSTRRSLAVAIGVPVGVGGTLAAVMLAYYSYAAAHSVLAPRDFAQLRVGQPVDAVRRVLPDTESIDPPTLPAPEGVVCRYYRSHGDIFSSARTYRLCFADDRLARKDVVRVSSGTPLSGS